MSITVDDLRVFAPGIDEAKAQAMIEDALGTAALLAPCLFEDEFEHPAAAKAILRAAILRWDEAGTGAVTQMSAGPFQRTVDTSSPRRRLFWPSEIDDLTKMCRTSGSGAFTVDTVPTGPAIVHADICSLRFGAAYCSCGAALTRGGALWEQ
ncbi:hypothetical protein Rrhod_0717 [Rhodococcus rhodnii LMG 5362]|uniref:Head-to-tail adaptor n=1 Tax=Rhodococcus rhodnii LMG 5362 TaxID=1273125 RepID=R7WRF8_9NOCA|nr:hypothetical protein Rrhod_0717 [Rhodococcus rhodnii LMG 5362]